MPFLLSKQKLQSIEGNQSSESTDNRLDNNKNPLQESMEKVPKEDKVIQ